MKKGHDIAARFIEAFTLLESKGIISSRKEAAVLLKCSPQIITEIINHRMNPTIQILQNFFSVYSINSDFIFLGKKPIEKPHLKPHLNTHLKEDINSNEVAEGNVKYGKKGNSGIPLVSIEALAGLANSHFTIEQKDIKEYYIVPDFQNIQFMLRVTGNSMYPKYNSGDVVACRILKDRAFIQWNKVHVIATKEQGILIKRLRKSTDQNHYTAISDNKDYDAFDIPIREINSIAIVVGVIRLE